MNPAIQALTIALFTAALALAGKILSDIWERHSLRRSIAAALAGELDAYFRLLDAPNFAANYRAIAGLDRAQRCRVLRAMPQLPGGHPVFDKVAEKIGLLPTAEASEVSSIYNVVSGLRVLLAGLSTPGMVEADCETQRGRLHFLADGLVQHAPRARLLVERLERIAEPSSWRRRRRS